MAIASALSVRKADLKDDRWLWRLAMDPTVRLMSTRSAEFSWEEHKRWFNDKLLDPNVVMYVLELGEQKIALGQCRYGRVPGTDSAEIAVSIVLWERGNGYAKILLAMTEPLALKALGVNTLIALVLKENIPSQRLFGACGYLRMGEEERLGKSHWKYVKECA